MDFQNLFARISAIGIAEGDSEEMKLQKSLLVISSIPFIIAGAICGDTVNLASRMESSGEPGRVNISGSTYELVKDHFHCTHRGKIKAKNKGEVDMYFVD